MYTCASCKILACRKEDKSTMPKNCPMHNSELTNQCKERYLIDENRDFYIKSSYLEAIGYGQWTRIVEIMEFSKSMGYTKIGMAFCSGLKKEAEIIDKIFRANGFNLISVICKAGGISKGEVGISEEFRVRPGTFEAMCNPIMQAELLNKEETEFNIVVGLCVGHDSMFYKYSKAFVTTLIVKDRVTAHNPCGAIYCADGYYKKKLGLSPTV